MRKNSTYIALLRPTRLLISEKSTTYSIKWSYTIIWQVRVSRLEPRTRCMLHLLKTDEFINYKYFSMMGFKINQTLPSKKSFHCAGVELDFKLIRVRPAFATFAFLKNIDQMLFKPLPFKRIKKSNKCSLSCFL